jgi:hypothetical protein
MIIYFVYTHFWELMTSVGSDGSQFFFRTFFCAAKVVIIHRKM